MFSLFLCQDKNDLPQIHLYYLYAWHFSSQKIFKNTCVMILIVIELYFLFFFSQFWWIVLSYEIIHFFKVFKIFSITACFFLYLSSICNFSLFKLFLWKLSLVSSIKLSKKFLIIFDLFKNQFLAFVILSCLSFLVHYFLPLF